MTLLIDQGNTLTKLALYPAASRFEPEADPVCRKATEHDQVPVALRQMLAGRVPQAAVFIGQAEAAEPLRAQCQAHGIGDFLHLTGATPFAPLRNRYAQPARLGADRWCAVVGAWMLHPHRDWLIADAGTCLTLDFLSARGEYLGGSISPGLMMRLHALSDRCPALPRLTLHDIRQYVHRTPPSERHCPTDTRTAMLSGVVEDAETYIYGMAARGPLPDAGILLTGGDAPLLLANCTDGVQRCPHLVEVGMRALYHYTSPTKTSRI